MKVFVEAPEIIQNSQNILNVEWKLSVTELEDNSIYQPWLTSYKDSLHFLTQATF